MMMTRMMLTMTVVAAVGAPGCDDGDGTTNDGPIELVGSWSSAFGDETITATRWDGFCLQKIASHDNGANVAVLETDGGEGCGTGFNRVVWLEPSGDSFYYCTTAFGAESAAAAANAPEQGVDRGDTAAGCAGFPWSQLTKKP
ncbi:MAG: hypothetical protein U1F43_22565 [Myxococcota bacterium]